VLATDSPKGPFVSGLVRSLDRVEGLVDMGHETTIWCISTHITLIDDIFSIVK
jgi:hypothetical protein